jgi:hypothetical protein
MNVALWIVQGLLAALFLFAGGMKLVTPAEELVQQSQMSATFLRFIGVVEVLGGLGVVLPWATGILPILTPLAAAGLVIVMIGATATAFSMGGAAMALLPLVTGIAAAFVAYGRSRPAPASLRR